MGQGASLACFSGGNGLHSAILEGEDGIVKQVSSLGSVSETLDGCGIISRCLSRALTSHDTFPEVVKPEAVTYSCR